MDIFQNIWPNLGDLWHIFYLVFIKYYGWIVFVIAAIFEFWRLYMIEIQHQFVHSQEYTFLSIRVPRENMVSTLAVETIFAQLHALHVGKTFPEKYMEGQIQLWYSLELISMGGKISFIIRVPNRVKDLAIAAFYAHYPQAEISETEDYLANFDYDPEDPDNPYEIFGSEWRLTADDVIPLKTYRDFEHPAAEETVVDPLANMFEMLASIKPYEFIGYQIIIQPLADEEWQPRGALKVMELTQQEIPHKATFFGLLLKPFDWFAHFSYRSAFFGGGHHGDGHGDELEKKPRSIWMSMTESEKERVNLIERKIGKMGYSTKIRMLYIVPKEKFDVSRKGLMCGPWRSIGSVMTNKLKPDVSYTWTGTDYVFSRTLEAPYLDWLLQYKKRQLFKGYKTREAHHLGLTTFILNIEELATLYHFPITTKTTLAPSAVEKTESKKSQPPVNLPIVDSGNF